MLKFMRLKCGFILYLPLSIYGDFDNYGKVLSSNFEIELQNSNLCKKCKLLVQVCLELRGKVSKMSPNNLNC